ncbi:hypothetical protein AB4Z45_32295 [Paenibacillus sp. MCAF9]
MPRHNHCSKIYAIGGYRLEPVASYSRVRHRTSTDGRYIRARLSTTKL